MSEESLGRLRTTALIAVLAGSVASLGFLLYSGRNSPQRLLMVVMAVWVLAPFAALLFADLMSTRWSALTRKTLHLVMLVVTAGSLAVYWNDFVRPRKAQAAFVFVLVPVVSWLVMAVVVPTAAFIFRRR